MQHGLVQVLGTGGYHETHDVQAKRVRELLYKSNPRSPLHEHQHHHHPHHPHHHPLASFQTRPGDRERSRFGGGKGPSSSASHVGAERLRLHLESKRQRRERLKVEAQQFELSAMSAEEAWQRHMETAIEAEERLLDFDLYVQITHKYGPMVDAFFRDLPRPGAVYRHVCHRNASRLARWWTLWWPSRLAKKGHAATQYQTGIRAYHARKRFVPIFNRIKFVQDRFYRSHFVEWAKYVAKINRARSYFDRILYGLRRTCFQSWTLWLRELKEERLKMMRRAMMKVMNRRLTNCYEKWAAYTRRNVRVRNMMKRALGETRAHLLHVWRENARAQKQEREERLASTALQRHVRGLQARRHYGQMKRDYRHALTRLQNGFRGFQARAKFKSRWKDVLDRKEQAFEAEVTQSLWELETRAVRAEEERATREEDAVQKVWAEEDQVKCHQFVTSKQGKAELKKVEAEVKKILHSANVERSMKSDKNFVRETARDVVMEWFKAMSKVKALHRFRVDQPPRFVSACPFSSLSFGSLAHCVKSADHKSNTAQRSSNSRGGGNAAETQPYNVMNLCNSIRCPMPEMSLPQLPASSVFDSGPPLSEGDPENEMPPFFVLKMPSDETPSPPSKYARAPHSLSIFTPLTQNALMCVIRNSAEWALPNFQQFLLRSFGPSSLEARLLKFLLDCQRLERLQYPSPKYYQLMLNIMSEHIWAQESGGSLADKKVVDILSEDAKLELISIKRRHQQQTDGWSAWLEKKTKLETKGHPSPNPEPLPLNP
jgi:hypothetical protein